MGLTGIVTEATLQLQPVETAHMVVDTERAVDLDDCMARMLDGDDRYRYSVAWIDCLAGGKRLGRSVLTRGNHAALDSLPSAKRAAARTFAPRTLLRTPPWLPNLINPLSTRAFNEMWFRKAPRERRDQVQTITAFFHPLDAVLDWNRIYGSHGFVQYQFVVPYGAGSGGAHRARATQRTECASFLAVLKRFEHDSRAMLGFPASGWTLALDVPGSGAALTSFLDGLDDLVVEAGGRVYLTKDSRLRPELVPDMYPQLDRWREVRSTLDPRHALAQRHGPPAEPHRVQVDAVSDRRTQVIGLSLPARPTAGPKRRPTALPRYGTSPNGNTDPSASNNAYPRPVVDAAIDTVGADRGWLAPEPRNGVAEREDPAVGGGHPVAVVLRPRGHADDRSVQAHAAGRAEELRVAEAEHATVTRVEPVAPARRRRRHPEDRRVQPDRARRAVELRVAEAEHAAVARDEPVALAGRCRRHPDDRLVEPSGAGRAVELRVAEGEDAAVQADQPVAERRRVRGNADDRCGETAAVRAAGVGQVAEREHLAEARRDPVAGRADRDTRRDLHAEVREHRLDGRARGTRSRTCRGVRRCWRARRPARPAS